MKVQIVKKEFNGVSVGSIVGFSDLIPQNYLVFEGFIECVDVPENINPQFLKVTYDLTEAYWSKAGESNLSVQPTIEANQPITQADVSWTYHPAQIQASQKWTKTGFATQYDQPPMIIVEGEEVEDVSWTYHPAVQASPEYWTKNGEDNVSIQPTIEVANYVEVNDTSWTYHPAQMEWILTEDQIKKDEAIRVAGVQKYVKRIQYADNLIAEIAQRNEAKVLTIPQTIEMNQVYSPIMGLLKSGSFASARSIILATTPSAGITSEDISYVVGLIEAYLTNEAQNG